MAHETEEATIPPESSGTAGRARGAVARRSYGAHIPRAGPQPAVSSDELTIDELARLSGMTVRNIRAHQGRGLIPPPEVRARTGYYRAEHVNRLRAIREMQAEGFNLRAISRVLASADGGGEQMLDFGRSLLRSFAEEEPEFATEDELRERFGEFDGLTLHKAQKLGMVRHLGEERYEISSPTLVRAGEELIALGIPLEHALAVAETIERHSGAIARAFVRLFVQDVLGSGRAADRAPEEWERVRDALERLRPLATEAVRAGFQQTMSRMVERELEKTLGR